ncbi:MAG: HEPN domain-containing protein [Candidatus Omnitrophica bacterium]|nr:HEPN domain-containing protein [Candidatus Omnitrophota bacterium]
MNQNYKLHKEWFKQDDYDLETAQAMFKADRYIYTVFMCHLSIEKALKGLYAKKFKKDPPKIHDLVYLIKKTGLTLPKENEEFLKILNELSVPTRYPDEIEKILKQYKQERTEKILDQAKELLLCLKEKL